MPFSSTAPGSAPPNRFATAFYGDRGRRPRWRRALPLAALVPVAGAIWFVQAFNPTDGRREVTGPCAWHALTGINGPTCGGTRAFYYLVHGDLIQAFRFHAPLAIAAPLLAYWWLAWALDTWFGVQLPRLRPRRWIIVTFVAVSLLFTTVLRNLPGAAMSWFDIPNLTQHMI